MDWGIGAYYIIIASSHMDCKGVRLVLRPTPTVKCRRAPASGLSFRIPCCLLVPEAEERKAQGEGPV